MIKRGIWVIAGTKNHTDRDCGTVTLLRSAHAHARMQLSCQLAASWSATMPK